MAVTVSLLHMNGANGGTVFTDESGKVWTARGSAVTNTTTKKFGTAAYQALDNLNFLAWIDTPAHADFNFGSGDFTIAIQAYNARGFYSGGNSPPATTSLPPPKQRGAPRRGPLTGVTCR
jgi:hypothetical protein